MSLLRRSVASSGSLIRRGLATEAKQAAPAATAAPVSKYSSDPSKTVVLVDGCRIPFALQSTIYDDLMAVDLARLSMKGMIDKVAMDPNDLDYVMQVLLSSPAVSAGSPWHSLRPWRPAALALGRGCAVQSARRGRPTRHL